MTLSEISLLTFLGIVPIVLLVAVLVSSSQSFNIVNRIIIHNVFFIYTTVLMCGVFLKGSGTTSKDLIVSSLVALIAVIIVLWSLNNLHNLSKDEFGKKYVTKTARIEYNMFRGLGNLRKIKLFDDSAVYRYRPFGKYTNDIDMNWDDDYDKVFYELKILPNSKIILEAKVLLRK